MTNNSSYCVIIPFRDKAENLRRVIQSLDSQTLRPRLIIVVDDRFDRSEKIPLPQSCPLYVVENPELHEESWIGREELAKVFNLGVKKAYEICRSKYFAIVGSDTVFEPKYFEKVIEAMKKKGAVIASGIIIGEKIPRIPRGSGRVFDTEWFRKNVVEFPSSYSWESYPIYLALSQGKPVIVVKDALMRTLRPTRDYEPMYGKTMAELGFSWWYVLIKSLIEGNPRLFLTYLRYPRHNVYNLGEWVKRYQRERIKKVLRKLLKM